MGDNVTALTTIFTEFYYWVTVVIMFLIYVGFCMYEVGVSRRRNHLHTLMKNTMVIPLVTITFFFFGWWIYWAFPNGPFIFEGKGLILDGAVGANQYLPWAPKMGTNLSDHITGVFWAAFLLFSWTVASIVSGSLIERVKSGAFWIIAVMIGSVTWIIDAAWGWHFDGWMVKLLGYHDAYASGVIHAIGGGTALGVLIVLGPRLGRFAADGTPRNFVPQNPWLVTIGLFLIYTGFWGFYAACNVPIISPETIAGQITGTTWTATTIYLTPTTLSAITFNFLMSLSGGLMVAYIMSKGDPFWTYSGGLAGIITASAGNDLYHPIQALHYWRHRHRYRLQAPLLGRAHVQNRRCGRRGSGARLRGLHWPGYRRLRAVGLSVLTVRGIRNGQPTREHHRSVHHVLRARLPAGMGHGDASEQLWRSSACRARSNSWVSISGP